MLTQHTTCSGVCIAQDSKKSPMDIIGAFLASYLAEFWCFQQRIGRGPQSALGSKRWELPLSLECLGGVLKEINFTVLNLRACEGDKISKLAATFLNSYSVSFLFSIFVAQNSRNNNTPPPSKKINLVYFP